MNSQQLNFYLTPQDQKNLETKLRAKLTFVAIEAVVQGRVLGPVMRETIDFAPGENLSICLLLPKHLPQTKVKYNEPSNRTFVCEMESPVVSFDRCFYDGKILGRGRFYAVNRFYGGSSKLIEKDDEFIEFAKNVISVTRKCLIKMDNYYGMEALKLKESGFTLRK